MMQASCLQCNDEGLFRASLPPIGPEMIGPTVPTIRRESVAKPPVIKSHSKARKQARSLANGICVTASELNRSPLLPFETVRKHIPHSPSAKTPDHLPLEDCYIPFRDRCGVSASSSTMRMKQTSGLGV